MTVGASEDLPTCPRVHVLWDLDEPRNPGILSIRGLEYTGV